jgi:hypothetical protein
MLAGSFSDNVKKRCRDLLDVGMRTVRDQPVWCIHISTHDPPVKSQIRSEQDGAAWMQALLACKLFTEIDRLYDNHYEALMVLWASNTPSKPQEGVPRKESHSHGRYRTLWKVSHFGVAMGEVLHSLRIMTGSRLYVGIACLRSPNSN